MEFESGRNKRLSLTGKDSSKTLDRWGAGHGFERSGAADGRNGRCGREDGVVWGALGGKGGAKSGEMKNQLDSGRKRQRFSRDLKRR